MRAQPRPFPVSRAAGARALPKSAGVGLKPQHGEALLRERPKLGFLEVHAENYFGAGGPPHALLTALRDIYPLSIHGVGLSIGGEGPLDESHLDALAALLARYEPALFSEHLAWSTHDGVYFNDLLPVAYNKATLTRVCAHIDHAQNRLKRPLLLENPSTYVAFCASDMDEVDFIAAVAKNTGCGLLLDVNNVMVSCVNHGRDPYAYIDALPIDAVAEIHLAGYAQDRDSLGARLLIDAHGAPVADDVWRLYAHAIARAGAMPTLIEWDNDVPDLPRLLDEAQRADATMAARAAHETSAA
ncbi:MAG: DUF692 domain-containing protein [Hyphomicrobiales bacterium]|nr:DUF692 domain-containing protein [Hyphomicrobiales bacterium]